MLHILFEALYNEMQLKLTYIIINTINQFTKSPTNKQIVFFATLETRKLS